MIFLCTDIMNSSQNVEANCTSLREAIRNVGRNVSDSTGGEWSEVIGDVGGKQSNLGLIRGSML